MRLLLAFGLLLLSTALAAREPTIREVQEEALRFAGYDPVNVSRWNRRAKWSAALPRLQVGFDRQVKDVVSLTTRDSVSVSGGDVTVGPAENRFDENFNEGTSFDVRAVWYLNELIFNRDTLEAASELRRWHQDRLRLLEQVNRAFFDRQEMLRNSKGLSPERLQQRTADLDALTGGWFSRRLEEK